MAIASANLPEVSSTALRTSLGEGARDVHSSCSSRASSEEEVDSGWDGGMWYVGNTRAEMAEFHCSRRIDVFFGRFAVGRIYALFALCADG